MTRPRLRLATPLGAALLIVGGVALGLLANELLRRTGPISAAPPRASPLVAEPIRLSSPSPPDPFELLLFAGLAAARLLLVLARGRRLLVPLVDLPMIGVLLAVSGGAFSPLDPTLPLLYVAAIVFLRGIEAGRASPRRLTLELLLGLVAVHLIVQRHDRRRLDARVAEQQSLVAAEAEAIRNEHGAALDSVEEALASLGDPTTAPGGGPAPGLAPVAAEALRDLRGRLADAQGRFRELLVPLGPEVDAGALGERKVAWQQSLDATYEAYFAARERWRSGRPSPQLDRSVASLDDLRETQWILRQELLDRLDDLEHALVERDRLRTRASSFLVSSTVRRAAIFGALLLFAAATVVLRDRLAAAVRAAEEERARGEVELAEREKEHWIALTAGLTHGLGNDILAYDVYLNELERLVGAGPATPERARSLLRFLIDSNRGRLGFLQFLDAFARHRQAARGDAPPIKVEPLELPPLLARVRRNLAQVELADLPPEGSDPGVDRQIRLLRDLPLEVELAAADAALLRRGHRGIVEFFVYELLKNALRSASGARPLLARLDRRNGTLELELVNDVEVESSSGTCPRCGADGPLRRVRRRRDAPPACDRCFAAALQELLDQSFAPGKGSGTGLGLFLIRYFLGAFWNGEIRARVADPAIPTVAFTLALPDPPATP